MNYNKVTKLELTDEIKSIVDKYDCNLMHACSYPKDGIHWTLNLRKYYIPFIITRNLDTIWYGYGLNYNKQNEPDKWFVVPMKSHPEYSNLKVYCKNFDELEDAIKYTINCTYDYFQGKVDWYTNKMLELSDWEAKLE